MSRLAVLSDIHGNYEALKAVISDMDENNVDSAVSLGDNIGYGPDPNLIVSTLKIYNIPSVSGNHELAVLNPEFKKWFNPYAREAIEITHSMLTSTSIKLISQYPEYIKKEGCFFVHGVPPDKILTYIFEISPPGIISLFEEYEEKYCFIGHTHQLKIFSFDGKLIETNKNISPKTIFKKDYRYIINSGSVGQPRDGNKSAKYLIFDKEKRSMELRMVDYDREITKAKILQRGFPPVYASMI